MNILSDTDDDSSFRFIPIKKFNGYFVKLIIYYNESVIIYKMDNFINETKWQVSCLTSCVLVKY